ncbi:unnamed protein product [Lathyrus oleraceus]
MRIQRGRKPIKVHPSSNLRVGLRSNEVECSERVSDEVHCLERACDEVQSPERASDEVKCSERANDSLLGHREYFS